jgi:RNA polymerase sigma-70 factor (ECF subfamily)
MSEVQPETDARGIAEEARARVRFEEEVLELSDQVYRVARRLVSTREEAEDLVQETYARAFRSWRSYTPGTNLRAWLFRILTNLNIDRGRREQRLHLSGRGADPRHPDRHGHVTPPPGEKDSQERARRSYCGR